MEALLLTINGGSSSLKFAVFRAGRPPTRLASGKIERIGLPGSVLSATDLSTGSTERRAVDAPDHASCVPILVALLRERVRFDAIGAIGHRVVHGGPRDGKPVDTSMAFTPTAGLVMSSRSGDLDPGVVAYLARTEGMTPEQFHIMVNAQSGLLGVSETSSDVRDLLECERSDVRAAEALALFCYLVKKWIRAFAAALGSVDMLVFTAGIGENASIMRSRICAGLGFLGITLDAARNGTSETVISTDGSRVTVCVIHTDEETEIADAVCTVLRLGEP